MASEAEVEAAVDPVQIAVWERTGIKLSKESAEHVIRAALAAAERVRAAAEQANPSVGRWERHGQWPV